MTLSRRSDGEIGTRLQRLFRYGRYRPGGTELGLHGRKVVRDALVAVDAGLLPGAQVSRVHVRGARALAREVHVVVTVAVAALERVVRFHARPFVLRELQTLVEKLLARVDRTEDLSPDLLRGLHLARDLVRPVVGHVTVGTDRAHAAAVGVVYRPLELGIDVFAHLVASLAEGLGVGELHCGVEAAPEHDAGDERADDEETQAQMGARAPDDPPVAPGQIEQGSHAISFSPEPWRLPWLPFA